MQPIRRSIQIKGVAVEMLVTPSIYGIARRKGIDLSVPKESSIPEVMDVYCRIAYCAAVNANEVARMDNYTIGEFALKYADFEEYRATHPEEFTQLVQFLWSALTQKPYGELLVENIKKKKRQRT